MRSSECTALTQHHALLGLNARSLLAQCLPPHTISQHQADFCDVLCRAACDAELQQSMVKVKPGPSVSIFLIYSIIDGEDNIIWNEGLAPFLLHTLPCLQYTCSLLFLDLFLITRACLRWQRVPVHWEIHHSLKRICCLFPGSSVQPECCNGQPKACRAGPAPCHSPPSLSCFFTWFKMESSAAPSSNSIPAS